MSYSIGITPFFQKEFKRLLKKHVSLQKDINIILGQLNENPRLGESIGNNCYKIRMSISSKNKGKSGGARIITYVQFIKYDKSEISNITEDLLLERIKAIKKP